MAFPAKKVHLIGIGGTGMGAVAGLLKAAGHDVRGSDAAVYPPMSEQLALLGVPVMMPYAPSNLDWAPDVVVVGNVHGKDHIEVKRLEPLVISGRKEPVQVYQVLGLLK